MRPHLRSALSVGVVVVVLGASACKRVNPAYCDDEVLCPNGGTCNLLTNECEPVDAAPPDARPIMCTDDPQCTAPNSPICGADNFCRGCAGTECADRFPDRPVCAADGRCVVCTDHSVCSEDTPICRDNDCAQCQDSLECEERSGLTPRCDVDSGHCVECLDHSDCTSGICDRPSGACVASSGVVRVHGTDGDDGDVNCGVDPAPACRTIGRALTRTASDANLVAILVAPVASDYAETVVVDGQTVSIVGLGATVDPKTSNEAALVVQSGAVVVVDGLTFRDAIGGTGADGVRCTGSTTALSLVRVTVEQNQGSGVEVRDCTVVMDGVSVANNQEAGLDLQDAQVTVARSVIADCMGLGVRAQTANLTLHRSDILLNRAGGLDLQNSRFSVVNNFIVGNGGGGTEFGGVRINGPQGTPRFEFNTVVDNISDPGGLASGAYCFGGIAVANNIVRRGLGARSVSGSCVWSYSNVEGGLPEASDGTENQDAPAMFVDATNGNFHLADNSPSRNKADPASDVTEDYDGEMRPADGRSDQGADEVSQ